MDRFAAMKAFVAVADARGFAPAAQRLGMSPSVVTRLVARLESQLGIRLLQRTTRSVTLTDVSGKRLVLPRRDIENLQASALSLMPEGLLDPLQPQEVRDLFAYLRKLQ